MRGITVENHKIFKSHFLLRLNFENRILDPCNSQVPAMARHGLKQSAALIARVAWLRPTATCAVAGVGRRRSAVDL